MAARHFHRLLYDYILAVFPMVTLEVTSPQFIHPAVACGLASSGVSIHHVQRFYAISWRPAEQLCPVLYAGLQVLRVQP